MHEPEIGDAMTQELVYNLSLVVALSVLAGFIRHRTRDRNLSVLQGLLFGSVAIIAILTPVHVPSGFQYDGRSVALSLCAMFFGPVAGIVAGVMAIICRMMVGGVGALTGVLVIISSVSIGWFGWRVWTRQDREPSSLQLYAFGLVVHVAMLLMFFSLPFGSALQTLGEITLPIMLTYPLATLLTGRILADQRARQRLFEQLKESDERFRNIFNSVPTVAIQTFTSDGTVLSWNKGSEIFYGYTAEEAIGRNLAELVIPPELMERYLLEFGKLTGDGGTIPDVEVTLRRKDGTPIVIHTRNGAIRLPGRPVEYFAMDVDLTERRAAEEKLRAQERMLANAHRIAMLGGWELELATNRLSWSDEVFSIFGIAREEFEHNLDAFVAMIHEEDRPAFQEHQARALDGVPLDFEHRIVRPDGEIRHVHERGELIHDAQGQPRFFSGTVQDITARKRAEEARRAAERLAQSTVDALTAHIVILDETGTIISVNHAWRTFAEDNAGVLTNLFEGTNYLEVCEKIEEAESADATIVARGIREVLEGGKPSFSWEYPFHSPTEQRWFAVRVTPFDSEGSRRVVVAHENITDRKLNEERTRADEERMLTQRNALIMLTEVQRAGHADLGASLRQLTEASAKAMGIARVGIWRYVRNQTAIQCMDLYELESDRHSSGMELSAEKYPAYFEALMDGTLITADDAQLDPRTSEFKESYLGPLGIKSMLDAPIHVEGKADGVLCHEHIGSVRAWTADEKTFALAMANLVTLALEGFERWRVEEALRTSLKELSDFRAALDEHAIVSIANAEGRITFANEKFCQISGYSREELLGQDHRIINSSYHPSSFFQEMWETISSGRVWKGEIKNKKKDGSLYWVDATIVPYLDDAGKPYQYVAVRTDITERKRADEEIRGLVDRLRHYLAVSPTITYALRMIDGRLQTVWVSENVLQVLGYTPEEAQEPTWWIAHVHPNDHDRVLANQPLIHQDGSLVHEYRFIRKDGQVVWMRDELRRVSAGEASEEQEFVGAWTEISERKRGEEERERLEAQLVQSQKMESIGRLAGGVAHDFNNMLSVIIGHAEMALEETNAAHPLRPDLEEIMRTSKRAAEITKQLLAFARRQTTAPRVLNLNETIEGMLSMLRRLTGAPIKIDWQPGRDLWTVRIDPAQVDQILANLIVNASDAITGQGTITITTRNLHQSLDDSEDDKTPMVGDAVELVVSDTGSGISEDILPHIFDPFFTTKDVGKGTGLGLATVYGILQQNQGVIDVFSQPGKGTAFKIRLPRFQPSEEIREKVGVIGGDASKGKEMILLVEDEQALLSLGIRFLTRLGYRVLASSDPHEAIHLFEENKDQIDLLMTDVVMPEMSGRQVWEAVNAIRPDLKCLFVSGYTADVIATHGVLSEGVHFLQKPYTVEALGRKLREVLDS